MAEVVTSGTAKPTGRAASTKTKKGGPPAHLVSFLVQACSTLPGYVLVFAKVCWGWVLPHCFGHSLPLLILCGVNVDRGVVASPFLFCPVCPFLSCALVDHGDLMTNHFGGKEGNGMLCPKHAVGARACFQTPPPRFGDGIS